MDPNEYHATVCKLVDESIVELLSLGLPPHPRHIARPIAASIFEDLSPDIQDAMAAGIEEIVCQRLRVWQLIESAAVVTA